MKVSETSLASYKMVHKEMLIDHWGKILSSMRILNKPVSMEEVAKHCGMEVAQVSRRFCDLERDTLIFKSGKGKTSKNRPCALYQLVPQKAKIEASADLRQADMF